MLSDGVFNSNTSNVTRTRKRTHFFFKQEPNISVDIDFGDDDKDNEIDGDDDKDGNGDKMSGSDEDSSSGEGPGGLAGFIFNLSGVSYFAFMTKRAIFPNPVDELRINSFLLSFICFRAKRDQMLVLLSVKKNGLL